MAVLGAGVMGSGIAAHMSGSGLDVLLLDIVPPNLSEEEKREAIRKKFLEAIERAQEMRRNQLENGGAR